MGALSLCDFARAILPFGSNGPLAMLSVYVDDSGTHSTSGVVLLAGLMAYPNQWDMFSELWIKKLGNPSPGKESLQRFHMVECQDARGEFAGWNRIATDFLVQELVQIFKKTMIRGQVIAILRKDYDELVVGQMRRAWGDAEGLCLRMLYMRIIKAASSQFSSADVAFIFDNRPDRQRENEIIFSMFQRFHEREFITPLPVAISFASSYKVVPLQMADLIAWELYQHSRRIFEAGDKDIGIDRPQLRELMEGGRITYGVATRDVIERMVETQKDDDEYFEMVGNIMERGL
jgi:Protein of unknown function (DUF3800)